MELGLKLQSLLAVSGKSFDDSLLAAVSLGDPLDQGRNELLSRNALSMWLAALLLDQGVCADVPVSEIVSQLLGNLGLPGTL